MARRLRRDEYTVGWVCALPIELTAAQEMLDEEHQDLGPSGNDMNIYCLGRIGEHNVVLAGLPAGQTGIASAAAVAMQMKATFPATRFGLMVGIGGGVPSKDIDIRLGDIVVSQPGEGHGGVVHYDFGKSTSSGFEYTGSLNAPPPILLAALTKLRANHDRGRSDFSPHLAKLNRLPKFALDNAGSDVLFEARYTHAGEDCCVSCDDASKIQRKARTDMRPVVHYGIIASGNQVMRDGATRDQVSAYFGGALCFETEAAGLMNTFPCLVIRGVCNYADSHKNKQWQPYAAGTAAAYTKELLLVIPAADVAKTRTADEATRKRKGSFHIPFLRNRQFVGRSIELDTLKRKLLVDKDCQKMAISGLGGIGKTQVALHFAYSVKQDHPNFSIFWVPVLSMETFEQAYGQVAKALGIRQSQEEDVKRLVQRRLSTEISGKWLLIIDNADDIDLLRGSEQVEGLLDFLPTSDDGLTLFTTRHHEVAQFVAGSDMIEIGKMETQQGEELMNKSLVHNGTSNNDGLMVDLLIELDCLPLAIIQAAAYINTNKSSISEYLGLLKDTEQDAMAMMSTAFGGNARYKSSQNAVTKTWMVSFNQILKQDPVAAQLLGFISCVEWKSIPRSILPHIQSKARMASSIGTLCSYSFLSRRENGMKLDMHRLVHLATRIWIRQNDCEAETRKAALEHLVEVFPSELYTNRKVWQQYLPHAARINKDKQCQDGEEMSELCLKVGRCLYVDGRTQEAVIWLQESYEWRHRSLKEEHPHRLSSQYWLSRAYQNNGQVRKAVELLEPILSIRMEGLAEDHPDRLASQYVLAGAYQANGQGKEAIKLLEHVIAMERDVLTEDHPNQLASQHELAGAYRANGRVREAIKLLEHVVEIRTKVLPEDHPDRLASQHVLAGAYQANGQIKEAVKLLEHVVKISTGILQENHPDRLASQHGLAGAYQANGRVKEAIKLLEHVVAIRTKALVEDHPNRLASQHELARAYQADGRVKEAIKLLEHVVEIHSEVLAEDHPDRLASQHELAGAYQANGRVKEAIKLLEHVVATRTKALVEDHPNRLASQHELARAYQADGQVKEAIKLLEHVVKINIGALAEDHPDRLASQHGLAQAYRTNGMIKVAIKLLENVVEIRTKVLPEDHPDRQASQHELARAYQANGQVKEAVKLLERVVTIDMGMLAEDHPDRLTSQHVLAGAYQAHGKVKEAVKLLEHVVAIRTEVLPEDHPDRLASQHELARAYQANGKDKRRSSF